MVVVHLREERGGGSREGDGALDAEIRGTRRGVREERRDDENEAETKTRPRRIFLIMGIRVEGLNVWRAPGLRSPLCLILSQRFTRAKTDTGLDPSGKVVL
jgi:hypothetical protein